MYMHKKLKATDVYDLLVRIPKGKVSTYGDIAKILGHRGASRAIGRILNNNPNPIVVPCHRVVMSNGNIGGYAFGKARKKELLKKEGLHFMRDNMRDFARCRTDLAKLR
jgi:methylated-DNA-[protein]-cysteine S-methyltransferase